MKGFIKKNIPKIAVFIFTFVFLSFQTASLALAATVSDSYNDESKIDSGSSSGYEVSGGQLKMNQAGPNVGWWKLDESSGNTVADSSGNGNTGIAFGPNVAWWKFDETSGTTAADSSGNNYTGTVYGATIATGKYGNARNFDGNNDYVNTGDLPDRSEGTIAFWFKPATTFNSSSSTTQGLWGKYESDNFDATISLRGTDFSAGDGSAGTIQTKIENSGATYLATTTNSWTGGQWYHFALTWGGGTTTVYVNGTQENTTATSKTLTGAANDEIGRSYYDTYNLASGGPNYFNGVIDDVRVYNYARSASQIIADMNDSDSSGIDIVAGKYGNARSFDGTNDYVKVPHSSSIEITGPLTIEAWVKVDNLSNPRGIIAKGKMDDGVSGTNVPYSLYIDTDGKLVFAFEESNNTNRFIKSTGSLSTGQFYHVAVTRNSSNVITFFINGAQSGQSSTAAPGTTNQPLEIGNTYRTGGNTSYFDGIIDDVRIYNYARTQSEIQDDMNNTAGPYVTSTTVQSTNLLSSESNVVTGINSFVYNLSSKPSGTTATIQFSQDGTNWYNSSGTLGGTDTLTTGANNTIDLSSLAWDGANFYYKIAFGGDGNSTPTLDDITLNYSTTGSCSFPLSGDYTITGSCAFVPSTPSRVADVISSENDGTATGTTIVKGKYGAARSFGGDTKADYINMGTSSAFDITGEMTITAWVYATEAPTTEGRTVASRYRYSSTEPDTGWNFGAVWQGTYFRFSVYDGAGTGAYASDPNFFSNNLNTWKHVAGVYKPSQYIYLYIDGELVASNTTNIPASIGYTAGDPLMIGRRSAQSQSYFAGRIDDVRIYNYARTADQIKEDMNNVPNPSGNPPVAHWTMDDGYVDGVDNGNLTIATGATLTINSGQTIVWNPGKSITIQNGASIAINTTGQLKQAYLWLKDADGDGYPDTTDTPRYSSSTPTKTVRRYLANTLSDCDDSNPTVTTGSTYYRDSDGDGYGDPNVSTTACNQPAGYVSNNSDCYDANANARPGQTACFSTHRGDGSFDYNCDGSQSNCKTCSTSASSGTYYWRQCSGGYCYTDPNNQTFRGWTCSGSTSTCGASGKKCSSSKKASGCNYYPCSLYNYKSTSVSSCTVTCK